MMVTSVEALFVALAFIVPGFIISLVRSQFSASRSARPGEQFFGYLTLSALNYALFSWLVYILIATDFGTQHPIWSALCWFLIILIGPAAIGLLLAVVFQKDWLQAIFARLRMQPIHIVPAAWDYQFGRMKEPHWLLVQLKDGSTIAGYFGMRSFASSDPHERDIFIQQVYLVDAEGRWQQMSEGHSVLIGHEQIAVIEFWPAKGG
jgi:hypothetical protein